MEFEDNVGGNGFMLLYLLNKLKDGFGVMCQQV